MSVSRVGSSSSRGVGGGRGGKRGRQLLPERTGRVLTQPRELFYTNSVILTSSTFIHLFNWVCFILWNIIPLEFYS